jgi:protein-tyrosine-phosphatase
MAAALAAHVFPKATIESAGWAAGTAVAPQAATVIREITGRDISSEQPRDVSNLDLALYDLVVVLEPRIADELVVPPGTLRVVWDVADPFGLPIEQYRRCAKDLQRRIAELAGGPD